MSFSKYEIEINAVLEPKFREFLKNIHEVSNPELELRGLVNLIHQKWKSKAEEFAKYHEEKGKKDREEFERKLREMERALEVSKNENFILRQRQSEQLHFIKKLITEHLKFSELHPEKLMDLCGNFCSVLSALIDQHEDVEVSKSQCDFVNLEVARILREKSVEMAIEHDEGITEYLDNNLSSRNIPRLSGNCTEIDTEIRKLKDVLHEIQSLIHLLTPEHWDEDAASSIKKLKSSLEMTTGNVLQLLETAEATHKKELEAKFIFQICQ